MVGSGLLHAAAIPFLVAVPGLRLAVAASLVADHALLTGIGLTPRSHGLGPNLDRLPGGRAGSDRGVALTFDDGPDPEVTPRVLDLLERHRARATFFCIGERVERHPDLVAEIARRGHRVENHTHRHLALFSLLLPGGLGREIDRAQDAIERATGRAPVLFRPPAGFRSLFLEPVLARRGLSLISWTRRGFDTVRRDPEAMLARLTDGLEPGEILLLHDGRAARTEGDRPIVLEVLPRLLDRLEHQGLDPLPIDPPGEEAPEDREALGG